MADDDDDLPWPLKAMALLYFGVGAIAVTVVLGPVVLSAAAWIATHYGISIGAAIAILKAKLKGEDTRKAGIEAGAEGAVVELIVGKLDSWFH